MTMAIFSKAYLDGDIIQMWTADKIRVVAGFLAALNLLFSLIQEYSHWCEVMILLHRPVCHVGFKRLN